ncbi:CAP domain-containing protein [Kineosporia succinea]|uniref:Uncharacterized protein YkwD n=1 Tax=Kineosporia succinea TaxID=84632 RepID=A0ABT9P0S7_9ACTN|nr:CAP domain-containing protein [Kineosporia succinea]MDP9826285.1 uncharacterized protein YkwD [Kineosporia succinea]
MSLTRLKVRPIWIAGVTAVVVGGSGAAWACNGLLSGQTDTPRSALSTSLTSLGRPTTGTRTDAEVDAARAESQDDAKTRRQRLPGTPTTSPGGTTTTGTTTTGTTTTGTTTTGGGAPATASPGNIPNDPATTSPDDTSSDGTSSDDTSPDNTSPDDTAKTSPDDTSTTSPDDTGATAPADKPTKPSSTTPPSEPDETATSEPTDPSDTSDPTDPTTGPDDQATSSPDDASSESTQPDDTATAPTDVTTKSTVDTTLAAQVITLVNQEREAAGCDVAVKANAALTRAALDHTELMRSKNTLDHQLSGEPGVGERIGAAGYTWRTFGENIAYNYGSDSASSVMDMWMKSSGHQANILNCSFEDIGVAAVEASDGRIWWTQDFGLAAS